MVISLRQSVDASNRHTTLRGGAQLKRTMKLCCAGWKRRRSRKTQWRRERVMREVGSWRVFKGNDAYRMSSHNFTIERAMRKQKLNISAPLKFGVGAGRSDARKILLPHPRIEDCELNADDKENAIEWHQRACVLVRACVWVCVCVCWLYEYVPTRRGWECVSASRQSPRRVNIFCN